VSTDSSSIVERPLKHLPKKLWPADDRRRLDAAFLPGDLFDEDAAPGAHLSAGTRRHIETAYRRWLGFVARFHPNDISLPAEDRITPIRVKDFIAHLEDEIRDTSIASVLDGLAAAARLIAQERDWRWLKSAQKNVSSRSKPLNRLPGLQPPWEIYDLGLKLMASAEGRGPDPHHLRDLAFRDGLILAFLCHWPIRRRSIASLTVDRHLIRRGDAIVIQLFPEDTKSRRADSFELPAHLKQPFRHYLDVVRPRLLGLRRHNALWVSQRSSPLTADGIYQIVERHTGQHFGQAMGLHDMRRAAATFVAIEVPEKAGLIPSLLQHSNPDTTDRHYKLADMSGASKRYAATLSAYRDRLSETAE